MMGMMEPWPFESLERGKYGAILADPPWRFRTWDLFAGLLASYAAILAVALRVH